MAGFAVAMLALGGVSAGAQVRAGNGVGVAPGKFDGTPVLVLRVMAPDSTPVSAAITLAQADSAARLVAVLGTSRALTIAHTYHGPVGSVTLRQPLNLPLEVTIEASGKRAAVLLSDDGAASLRALLARKGR